MTTTSALVVATLSPVLEGTVFDKPQTGEPPPELAPTPRPRSAGVIWCAATTEFVRRHPTVTAAVDVDHPDGCTDLSVYVDEQGLLERAFMECLDLDDGLVGLPIEEALPAIATRIADALA